MAVGRTFPKVNSSSSAATGKSKVISTSSLTPASKGIKGHMSGKNTVKAGKAR